jgi:hypothetical protein
VLLFLLKLISNWYEELLTTLIAFLSQQQETNLPQTVSGKVSRLVDYLRASRCLLVLDNFDTVLASGTRVGSYRQDYEGYGELLHQIGERPHPSCLILTSREKPAEVATLQGEILPVRALQLKGLYHFTKYLLQIKREEYNSSLLN